MWSNPATQRNVARLVADGVVDARPGHGRARVQGERRRTDARGRGLVRRRRSRRCSPRSSRASASCSRPDRRSRPSTRCAASPTRARARWASRWRARRPRPARTVTVVSGPSSVATPPGVERVDVRSAARDGRRGPFARRRQGHLHRASPPSPTTRPTNPQRPQDQEIVRRPHAHAEAHGGHPGHGRVASESRRTASASRQRATTSQQNAEDEAQAEESAAADRQPRAGCARQRHQRSDPARRCRRTSAAENGQARAGKAASSGKSRRGSS